MNEPAINTRHAAPAVRDPQPWPSRSSGGAMFPGRTAGRPSGWFRAGCLALMLGLLATAGAQGSVRVLTHSSFDLPLELIERFTAETGIRVELLPSGDAGELVNRAVLTAGRPLGDVLFGVDNGLLPRVRDVGVFEPYESPLLEHVPAGLLLDEGHLVTPVTVGFVNFNLDRAWFEEFGPAPVDLAELTDAEFRGLTVVQDPAASSPGLAFMLTTIARFGEGGDYDWLDWWADLRDNDVLVTSGWTDAYYTAFTLYGGDRPIVLSYASSPAAEVIFASEPLETAPTANLFCDLCVWRQIEGAGVLAGAANPDAARAFVDFLLSPEVQEAVPAAMFVYPVRLDVPLPAEFDLHAAVPEEAQIADLDPELVAENQERWLGQWTQVVQQGRDPASVR